jgi:hypothetical protein
MAVCENIWTYYKNVANSGPNPPFPNCLIRVLMADAREQISDLDVIVFFGFIKKS